MRSGFVLNAEALSSEMRTPMSSLLLLLSFVLSLTTARAETSVTPELKGFSDLPIHLADESSRISESLCSSESCAKCDSCDYGKLKSELFYCKRAVDVLQMKLSLDVSPLDIARECSFEACYPGQRKLYCRVIEHDPKHDFAQELDEALRLRKTELAQLKARIKKLEQPRVLAYGKKMDKAREAMALQRARVLKARSYNSELKKYLESFELRMVLQEVKRFQSENEELHEHLKFWETQNLTLFNAVRLSPRAVQDARDDLHARMLDYEADARLLEVIRNSSFTKEDQVKLVADLKIELRHQLDHTRTVNAHAKTEAIFIEKAGEEIYSLLASIMNKMQQGQVSVGCGETALSKSVQNELVS